MGYRVAFDIGGTFTDLVLQDDQTGEIWLHKLLTTPANPSEGSLRGIDEITVDNGVQVADLDLAVHGTTLVTNAVIERKGARVGLVTTRGFRDAVEIGREQRYDIDDLFITFPDPLVERELRKEVDERMSRDGQPLRPLSQEELDQVIAALRAKGVDSIAISFLHSYRNPKHEEEARAFIRERLDGVPMSISSEVAPEIREYERTITTIANAYVQPMMERYLSDLEGSLDERGFGGRFYLMQSNGGTASVEVAKRFPIKLLESGPAGGATYAAYIGGLIGKSDLLAFDMGGTTAKACLIQGGAPDIAPALEAGRVHRFKRGSGLPIRSPVIDMIEIGAGGGSIARVNALGLLQVGPDSAGANPGPACYGLGGVDATVTDANVVLGYLNPDYFLGGRLELHRDRAEAAVEALASRLGLDEVATAVGIYRLVNENMAAAARIHIVEKGQDPRRFTMVAFGGAAPAHACEVARLLGAPEVVIPQAAGTASALGFLVAPLAFDMTHSFPGELRSLPFAEVRGLLARMEAEGRARLEEAGHRGEVHVQRSADMRILGQVHEISVSLPPGDFDQAHLEQVEQAFYERYRALFEHLPPVAGIEVINWRVRVSGPQPSVSLKTTGSGSGEAEATPKAIRPSYFTAAGGFVDTPVYDRYTLRAGHRIDGPAIIEEREATTVVPPGDRLIVDEYLQLRIQIAGGGHEA